MGDINLTQHAKDRVRERVGLPKKAAEKLAKKAYEEGVSHKEATGRLKNYFTYLFMLNNKANNIRAYNNFVYLFAGSTLITVLSLPKPHHNAVKKIISRRQVSD